MSRMLIKAINNNWRDNFEISEIAIRLEYWFLARIIGFNQRLISGCDYLCSLYQIDLEANTITVIWGQNTKFKKSFLKFFPKHSKLYYLFS